MTWAARSFVGVLLLLVAFVTWWVSGQVYLSVEKDNNYLKSQLESYQQLFPGETIDGVSVRLEQLEKKLADPKIELISRREIDNPDGTYTLQLVVKVVSFIVPPRLTITAIAHGLKSVKIKASGFHKTRSGANNKGVLVMMEDSIASPEGQYTVEIMTEEKTKIDWRYSFTSNGQ